MALLEKEIEKLAIEEIEAAGMAVFKTPKFSDRKHQQRKVDLGAPDLWIFYKGKCVALEMKALHGQQSDVQKAFQERMRVQGIPYYIARSLDDVDNIIRAIRQL